MPISLLDEFLPTWPIFLDLLSYFNPTVNGAGEINLPIIIIIIILGVHQNCRDKWWGIKVCTYYKVGGIIF